MQYAANTPVDWIVVLASAAGLAVIVPSVAAVVISLAAVVAELI